MENAPRQNRRQSGLFGPVILIIIGIMFLLERTGVIQRELVSQWWPLLLIVAGGCLLARRINRSSD